MWDHYLKIVLNLYLPMNSSSADLFPSGSEPHDVLAKDVLSSGVISLAVCQMLCECDLTEPQG